MKIIHCEKVDMSIYNQATTCDMYVLHVIIDTTPTLMKNIV